MCQSVTKKESKNSGKRINAYRSVSFGVVSIENPTARR